MLQLLRAFSGLIPLFLIVSILTIGVIITISLLRKKLNGQDLNWKKLTLYCGVIVSLIGIFFVTNLSIFSTTGITYPRIYNLIPVVDLYNMITSSVTIGVPLRNILLNVCLFIPFGFLVTLTGKNSASKVILSGTLLSCLMELLQYIVPRGRTADINDVILNTLGTLIGYFIAKYYKKILN